MCRNVFELLPNAVQTNEMVSKCKKTQRVKMNDCCGNSGHALQHAGFNNNLAIWVFFCGSVAKYFMLRLAYIIVVITHKHTHTRSFYR